MLSAVDEKRVESQDDDDGDDVEYYSVNQNEVKIVIHVVDVVFYESRCVTRTRRI